MPTLLKQKLILGQKFLDLKSEHAMEKTRPQPQFKKCTIFLKEKKIRLRQNFLDLKS